MDTNEATADQPIMLVLDVQLGTTADEMGRLLNEHCARGFYVNAVTEWPGVGARVVLRRYATPAVKPARVKAINAEPPRTKEVIAMQYMRDHREMSGKELMGALKALGFPRGLGWISQKRGEIIRANRRVV